MFGRSIKLFKLFGFQVSIDLSWLILGLLVTWSLAAGVFPRYYDNLDTSTYWLMGAAGAIGLFLSIVVHEFCHSLVARQFGLPMKGITLFIFGGVAEMNDEPPSPGAEFFMAIAGPLASIAIGLVLLALSGILWSLQWQPILRGILMYLGAINLLLAAFNSIPAFPLDGGRILRSALWKARGNLRWATRVTAAIGSGFGILLIVLGVMSILGGNFIGGLWWCLIGLFVRQAASMSYQQVLLRRALEGEPVRRFMKENPVTVPPDLSVDQLVENYVYEHHYKLYPVVEDGHLRGCLSLERIKELPREEWDERQVRDVADQCSNVNTIGPDADAMDALSQMKRHGVSRLMVVEGDRLVGVLTLKDMLDFLSLRVELEDVPG